MEGVGNPTRSPAGPTGSRSESSFWNDILKDMVIAILSGVLVTILWKCIKAMLNTYPEEQPDAAPLPNPPLPYQEEIELESVLSSPQSSKPVSSPSTDRSPSTL
ncbi:hypothetical protein FH972_026168 [Carpinus fangiana]|uniref:Uncharacterized protein n=1 Tax=Carpinus fangiana TaxID=176857 RepID=A0A5N6L459_9ROSI|nr:hypothetical protein FH972_026168 [Carpinus fangiana]